MGDDNPIIHRSKLFGGRETAMEVHRRLAWGNANCKFCGAPAACRVQIFIALSDMSITTRMAIEFEISQGRVKPTRTAGGLAIKATETYACTRCKPTLLRQAGKGPSYAMVDIDEGPGEDKPLIQVVGGPS